MTDSNSYDPTVPTVIYEASDGIATITMDRPSYHNAQNGKMT